MDDASQYHFSDDGQHPGVDFLPLMPLREVVVFPHSIVPLFVGRGASINAIESSLGNFDKKIFLVAQRSPDEDTPGPEDLYPIGSVGRILQVLRLPDGTVKVLFEGLFRASWDIAELHYNGESADSENSFMLVRTTPVVDADDQSEEAQALMRTVRDDMDEYSKTQKKISPESVQSLQGAKTPGQLADMVMSFLKLDYQKKQEVMEIFSPMERLAAVGGLVQSEMAIASVERNIKNRVKSQMERNQREYYLNEQIKAIHKEMGRDDDPQAELVDLEKSMEEKDMPEEARERGMSELKKLRYMSPSSAEYTVVRNYVDWILDLPWNVEKKTDINIETAKAVLDRDHFGLEKPKERILEYLAVQKLSNKLRGPILCLVGPPGVGKTSLAKSVAQATGREFVRLSLGGVRDEAEIRGHRRTYVGALPGKIIQSLKRVKSNNPLFCLDEIDKMSADFRGDPAAALLEVLDPEQNNTFNDHYLDLDYDLSRVFFITTANSLYSIPGPLQDRMEIIRLPGYLETEKQHIARDFLLPKQIEENGLKPENITISDKALLEVIRSYTREAGVRSLEREIATICRKTAMSLVAGNDLYASVSVGVQSLPKLLGIKKYRYGEKERSPQVGVCTGLAYTEVGGDILMVETAVMPGTGKLNITGKLGDVMTESAKAALSYVRSRSAMLGLKSDFHKEVDIHMHVPDGATPKDGPSAGITLATSLVSALVGMPVRNDLAMTGEITLRGRVLPIGGLREKLLAAHRAGIKIVLVPSENAKDLKEVPQAILRDLEIKLVEDVDEVLPQAILSNGSSLFVEGVDPLAVCHSLRQDGLLLNSNPQ